MYGYIPFQNVPFLRLSYSVADPSSWQFERLGQFYGGVEESEFTEEQKAEIIQLGGMWYETADDFLLWMNGNPLATLNAFLFEVQASDTRTLVCNLPILTGGNSFVLDVTVRDQGQPDRIVPLVCTNTALVTLPDGTQMPEFDYLVAAIRQDTGLHTLTTQMLLLRNAEGHFDQIAP